MQSFLYIDTDFSTVAYCSSTSRKRCTFDHVTQSPANHNHVHILKIQKKKALLTKKDKVSGRVLIAKL